jgi:hypothetical protein
MSRKDYVQIAIVLKDAHSKAKNTENTALEWAIRRISDELATVFKRDNSRFSFEIWDNFIFETD